MLDSTIASFFYINTLVFHVADSPILPAVIDLCIEFGQQHPRQKYKALMICFLKQHMKTLLL